MRIRKKYGDANRIGHNVARIRRERHLLQKDLIAKMQTMGIDINTNSFSKLEGQTRSASFEEGIALSEILGVSYDELGHDE